MDIESKRRPTLLSMLRQIEKAITREDENSLESLLSDSSYFLPIPDLWIHHCLLYHKSPRCYELLCLHNGLTPRTIDGPAACCNRLPHLFEHLLWSGADRGWMGKLSDDKFKTLQNFLETTRLLPTLLNVCFPSVIAQIVLSYFAIEIFAI